MSRPRADASHDAHKQPHGLSEQVLLRDSFPKPLRTIAGLTVALAPDGNTARACAVLLDAHHLTVLDQRAAHLPIPRSSCVEDGEHQLLPVLLAALEPLMHSPDLVIVEGHGIAHPQRFGIASHLGVVTGLPSIGVATTACIGQARMALHDMRGAFTPLRDGNFQIGWLLRSKPGMPPLVVSPGHKIAMPSAPELVMHCVTRHHLPEPLRLAQADTGTT